MAAVVLENVSRIFPRGKLADEVVAVDRVDLAVADGELLVLVGPSGCGKSTTLRLIAGLEDVSQGMIRVGGRVVNGVAPRDRDIAMMFQNHALYPHLSVYKNMAFGLELRRGPWWRRLMSGRASDSAPSGSAIADQVHEAARTLGIENLLARYPRQLSGGERQRVALGRAIVRRPAAFLFDEPLSNLDARLRVEMRNELKWLHERLSATMIYVTHDQAEALALGQRVAVMDRGAIQQVGTASEIYDRPKNQFVASFIGSPGMNLIAGDLDASTTSFRRGSWRIALDKARFGAAVTGPATLGVRAEDVRVEERLEESDNKTSNPGIAGDSVPGRVIAAESLGDATLLAVECNAGEPTASQATANQAIASKAASFNVVTKIGPRAGWRVGQRVSLSVDAARVHLFEPVAGRSLARLDGLS